MNSKYSHREIFFDYCLKIFLVVGTLFFIVPPPNTDPMGWNYMAQEEFFKYGVIFLYAISLMFKSYRKFECKSIGIFFIYCVFISLLGEFGDYQKYYLQNVFFGILFYQLIYERVRLEELKKYSSWLYWLIFANFVLCVFQWFDKDLIFTHIHHGVVPSAELVVGFMRLQAALGILASFIAPVLWIVNPFLVLLVIPLLFWAKSSAAVLAFVVSMGFLSYFRLPKRLWIALAVLVLVLGSAYVLKCDMPSGQFGERFKIWWAAMNHALTARPFTGLGLGSFAAWQPQSTQITQSEKLTWLWAHNEYIQTIFELGITGFVMLICFLKGRFLDFSKSFKNRECQALFSSFISILIVSFFHFPFHMGKMIGLTLFLMAAYHAKSKEVILEAV